MHILERFPSLQWLTPWEVEGIAQELLLELYHQSDREADETLRKRLDRFCLERDERGQAIDEERVVDRYEARLTPIANEEQREAIAATIGRELRSLPLELRLAVALELYDFARLEEGPPDPIFLAELEARIEEVELHPEQLLTMEEVRKRLEALKAQIKARQKKK